jgi:hypothetical protein
MSKRKDPKTFTVKGYGEPTMGELLKLWEAFSPAAAWALVNAATHGGGCAYGGFTIGQYGALVNILMAAIHRDDRELAIEEIIARERMETAPFSYALGLMVNRRGTCLPQLGVGKDIVRRGKSWVLSLPDPADTEVPWFQTADQQYANIFDRGIGGYGLKGIGDEISEILRKIEPIKHLVNGPAYPLVIPQVPQGMGYRDFLNWILGYLPAVLHASCDGWKFLDKTKGEFEIGDCRHQALFDRLKAGEVRGVLFPECFRGWPVTEQYKMEALMPNFISLAGPIEFALMHLLYAPFVSSHKCTLIHDCSAVRLVGRGLTPHFIPNLETKQLCLEQRPPAWHNRPRGDCSGGLFVQLPDEV